VITQTPHPFYYPYRGIFLFPVPVVSRGSLNNPKRRFDKKYWNHLLRYSDKKLLIVFAL
jgi:hypothetical protein